MPARQSVNISSPHAIAPSSGVCSPAMHISVVVLPQPEGPSRVTNSLSRTVKLTPSSTLFPANDLDRFSIVMSGMTDSPQDTGAEPQHDGDDQNLHDGKGGHRPDNALAPVLEHGDPEDLGARF